MRFKYLSCIAVMVLTGFTACQDSDDVGENYTTFTGETISDFLENNAVAHIEHKIRTFYGSLENGQCFLFVGVVRSIHLFRAGQ